MVSEATDPQELPPLHGRPPPEGGTNGTVGGQAGQVKQPEPRYTDDTGYVWEMAPSRLRQGKSVAVGSGAQLVPPQNV
jgi:hypothetical protein